MTTGLGDGIWGRRAVGSYLSSWTWSHGTCCLEVKPNQNICINLSLQTAYIEELCEEVCVVSLNHSEGWHLLSSVFQNNEYRVCPFTECLE
jgi:hypothetical protein